MLHRTSIADLHAWRHSADRKPLILRGARQVGKTTLVRAFGKEFGNFVELNLELATDRGLFATDQVRQVVQAIELGRGVSLAGGDTLLFIDEIQASPQALHLLRYFHEERPDLHVVAAGSLLEFAFKQVQSMPVGRVSFLHVHPMNFEEYLMALGNTQALEALDRIPLEPVAHDPLMRFFHDYALVGGMPEVVAAYTPHGATSAVPGILRDIWASFRTDAEKYARNPTEQKVLAHVLTTAPHHLERITMAGFGQSNYRSREVGEAFHALGKAGVVRTVYPTTATAPPVLPDLRKRPRLQFLDTGMLLQAIGIQAGLVGIDDLYGVHGGHIIQHLVVQEVMSADPFQAEPPLFWVRERRNSMAEVDMVLTHGPMAVPVEVKSGAHGRLRSLQAFVDMAPHPYAVRLHAGRFGVERLHTNAGKPFLLLNLPYFMGTRLRKCIAWFVAEHRL